jgi:hypothetical protein
MGRAPRGALPIAIIPADQPQYAEDQSSLDQYRPVQAPADQYRPDQ